MKKSQPKIKSGELLRHIGNPNDVSFFWHERVDGYSGKPNLRAVQPAYGDYIMLLEDHKAIFLDYTVPHIHAVSVLWIKKNKIVLLPSSYLTRFEVASELKEG